MTFWENAEFKQFKAEEEELRIVNVSGITELSLMLIGTSKNPSCFRKIIKKAVASGLPKQKSLGLHQNLHSMF